VSDTPTPPVDQTAVVQKLIDNDYRMAPKTYTFARSLSAPDGHGLGGTGFVRSTLEYHGYARDEGCVDLPKDAWGFLLEAFTLRNMVSRPLGCGIRAGNTDLRPAFGTQSGGGELNGLLIDGFEYGMRFGNKEYNSSTSEMAIRLVKTAFCTTGLKIETPNSLNYEIDQFSATDCDYAIRTEFAGHVHVNTASFTRINKACWEIIGASTYTGTGLRAEGSGLLIDVGFTNACVDLTLIGCGTGNNQREDQVDVLVRGGVKLVVIGGTYAGTFQYEGVRERMPGHGTMILDGVATRNPVLLRGTPGCKCRYEARNCSILDANGDLVRRVDQSGILGDDVTVP
jgi:hypothetical protein